MFIKGQKYVKCEFEVDEELEVSSWNCNGKVKPNCRFIRVTEKGFNIIDLDTNRAILRKHLYGMGMAGKEYNKTGPITVKCWIPCHLMFKVKKSGKTGEQDTHKIS